MKRLTLTNKCAIAFGLLPALIIVGSEFWHSLLTGEFADYAYALTGLLLVGVISTVVYLPYITDKVSYGEKYGTENAFLWTFVGLTLVMMFYGGDQAHVTGWLNPVPLYIAYVGVGIIVLVFGGAIIMAL